MSDITPEETELLKNAKADKTHSKLRKKNIKLRGEWQAILAGKPTSIPNRRIYLLNPVDGESHYSLWLIEVDDEDVNKIHLWPYKCPDTEKSELIKELGEEFLATAFD